MKAYRKWVLSLGIAAVTPGLVMAGPFGIFNKKSSQPARPTAVDNQKLAEQVASNLRAAELTGFDIDIGNLKLVKSEKVCMYSRRSSLLISKLAWGDSDEGPKWRVTTQLQRGVLPGISIVYSTLPPGILGSTIVLDG